MIAADWPELALRVIQKALIDQPMRVMVDQEDFVNDCPQLHSKRVVLSMLPQGLVSPELDLLCSSRIGPQ